MLTMEQMASITFSHANSSLRILDFYDTSVVLHELFKVTQLDCGFKGNLMVFIVEMVECLTDE